MAQTPLAEGKTKIIWPDGAYAVVIESKDDITAGDGARHDLLEGKAVYSTQTTCNCFELLQARGIPTHYLGRGENQRTFRARRVNMIPLELVARRVATGSYIKRRPDVAEGTIFEDLMVEFFEKDDPNNDPLVIFDFASLRILRYLAKKPLSEGFMNEQPLKESPFAELTSAKVQMIIDIVRLVFEIFEEVWVAQGVDLIDFKIEGGWDVVTGEFFVADVIDNDSWRIWPGGDKAQMKDKQVYRELDGVDNPAVKAKELGRIKENYAWVAEATGAFIL